MRKLRIFLADDHAMIRVGLRSLIDGDPDMTVVGEACNGIEAVALAPALVPDVIVLDISMPKMNGAQAATRLKAACPTAKILALSVHEDRGYLRELLEAGASGYALKRAAADELIRAIHVVADGGTYIDPQIAGEIVRTLVQPAGGENSFGELSDRETQVLRLIAEGHSIKEVAAELAISVKTVETYKARSMEKLRLKSRVDIVQYAKEAGWFNR